MAVIRYPSEIDLTQFTKTESDREARYGLPRDIRFCSRCVISNQRPSSSVEFRHTKASTKSTIHFDDEGVCDACRFTEMKSQKIDWAARDKELKELCDRFRRTDGRYDCIVPGSGGKDSFYASHVLKHKYGMHPLTVTWAPHMYTDWGWKNFQSWIHAGFDNYLMTPNGAVHRLLTRLAVDNLFHPFQPFIFGQKNLAPKLSLLFDVPLVFYGENEAEYGNKRADAQRATRDLSYFAGSDKSSMFFGGVSYGDLVDSFGVDETELSPYLPADPNLLEKRGTEVHYLGYYLKWHPQGCYYYTVQNSNFQPSPERTAGTYSKYNSIDDKVDDFHYYTTFIKFGIGRSTYDAAQEIRSGDITREEGVALVKRFDGEYPERFEKEVFEYLSVTKKEHPRAYDLFEQPEMDRTYFTRLADTFRSPHLWLKGDQGWKLRATVHESAS